MMHLLAVSLLLLQAATPAQAKRVAWVPNPRMDGGWVADPSHHLQRATIDSLNAMAARLEHETSDEIAVVVVDSTSGLEAADFALAVHRAWGVGKGTRDNGIVVLWVPPTHDLYVSVGYGLEGRLIDGRVGRIRDESFFPAFKAKAFDRGMLDGVSALVAAAREEGTPMDRIKQAASRAGPHRSKGFVLTVVGVVLAAVLALLALFAWIGSVRYLRFHRCPKCRTRMRHVDAPDEQASLLDPGQRVEERLRSVRHDFWICPSCGTRDSAVRPRRRAVELCPRCKYRTLERTRQTIVAATTSHGGQDRIKHKCANCDYASEETVDTARVVESPGGSSGGGAGRGGGGGSSGGSFGGGSAGGGGAGGRY
jgi:uncharacterized protein